MLVRKKYLRDTKGNPFGCMIAIDFDGVVSFGWSLCDKNDRFYKSQATEIASGRARANLVREVKVPHRIEKRFDEFMSNVMMHLGDNKTVQLT